MDGGEDLSHANARPEQPSERKQSEPERFDSGPSASGESEREPAEPERLYHNATVWARAVSVSVLSLITISFLTHGAVIGMRLTHLGQIDPEAVDKIVWLVALACAAAMLGLNLLASGRSLLARPWRTPVMPLIGLTGLLLGVAWIEPFPDAPGRWFGFGTAVLILAVVLVPGLYVLLRKPDARLVRYVGVVSVALFAVLYLPSIMQPIWGIIDRFHSSYIYNEVVAPTQGHLMLGEQVPQYTSLFGLPLVPVWWVFPNLNGSHAAGVLVSSYLTLLAVVTIAGLVLLAYRVLPIKLRPLALILTVPLVLVKVQPPIADQSSIASLLSALPIRTLPVIIVGLLLTAYAGRPGLRWALAAGVAAGLAALNNFEFGVPCALAALLVVWLSRPDLRSRLPGAGVFLLAATLPFCVYTVLLWAVGQPVHPDYWVAFALSFGSGVGSVEMPVVGLHILVLALLIAGVVIGSYCLRAEAGDVCTGRRDRHRRAAVTALFFGLAGLGSFGYYVGRSVVSGQLQIFLFYLAPIIAAGFTLVPVPRIGRTPSWTQITVAALVLLPGSLAIAAIVQAPDAREEWARVMHGKPSDLRFPFDDLALGVAADVATAQQRLGGTSPLVTAVQDGNLVEAYQGLPNYSAIDVPGDAWLVPTSRGAFCDRLTQAPGPIFVEDFVSKTGEPLCSGYRELAQISEHFTVVQRVSS